MCPLQLRPPVKVAAYFSSRGPPMASTSFQSAATSYAGPIAQTAGTMPPTLELLSYYRKRIEEFEAERAEFLKRFKSVEVRTSCDLKIWTPVGIRGPRTDDVFIACRKLAKKYTVYAVNSKFESRRCEDCGLATVDSAMGVVF